MTHKECKAAIRTFMRAHYTDERLAWLLAHARAGRLAYDSCCCFVGISTWPGDHAFALKGQRSGNINPTHNVDGKLMEGGREADSAYGWIGVHLATGDKIQDERRRQFLIPMIRAEMKRRERALIAQTEGALDVLTLYPADMVNLVDFVNAKDADWGRGTCEPCPTFSEEQ